MDVDFSTGIKRVGDAMSAVISAEVTAKAQTAREEAGLKKI